MRCDNCGWSNPEGVSRCQKCNQELVHAPISSTGPVSVPGPCAHCGYPLASNSAFCPNCGTPVQSSSPQPSQPSAASGFSKTVRVIPDDFMTGRASAEVLKQTVREIPEELRTETSAPSTATKAFTGTVRVLPEEFLTGDPETVRSQPEAAEENRAPEIAEDVVETVPSFRLVPLDNFDGLASRQLSFDGPEVSLARKDVMGDASVAEDVQAAFEFENGQWSVSDRSGKNTTFVCASHRIALEKGDIIVIGNRRYIFE